MTRHLVLALVATVLLGACSDSPAEPGGKQAIGFETVAREWSSGFFSPHQEVVRDQQRWSEVWSQLHLGSPPPARPNVDFGTEMVVLAAIGTRPNGCFSNEIRRIESTPNGTLEVEVAEIESESSCACTLALVQPVHAVRLDRSNGQVVFRTVTTTKGC